MEENGAFNSKQFIFEKKKTTVDAVDELVSETLTAYEKKVFFSGQTVQSKQRF